MTFRFGAFARGLLVAAVAAFTFSSAFSAPAAPQPAFNATQKTAIEAIVRSYILEHPEILPQAMEVLQTRMTQQTIAENRKAIFEDPDSAVGGNPNGDVTIVEFFDYTCGYCKMMSPMLNDLIRKDGKIRFIYKEWPVRGPVSEFASEVAIAAQIQNRGKYTALHNALFATQGQLTEDRIMAIAQQQGFNVDKLRADMKSAKVQAVIDRNHQLGQTLGLRGTPAFIIGGQIIPGAVSAEEMTAAIKRARAAKAR